MIVLTLASSILVFHAITSNSQSLFAQIKRGIVISIANSSYVPLTNTDANQVKVNVDYTVDDESLQNQVINAVMAVFSPNGTLLKTTSFPTGFTAQSDGGTQTIKTSFKDKSLTSVTANVTFTDATKSRSISNVLTINLDLEETPTVGSLLGTRPSFQN